MKLILRTISIIFFLVTVTSCLTSDNPVWYFFNEPAIVAYDGQSVVLRTSFDRYLAPELDNEGLASGQCLMSNFIVDYAINPGEASAVTYFPIKNSSVQVRSGVMPDTFTDSIATAGVSPHYVDTTLFFTFTAYKSSVANAKYDYELFCNTDSTQQGKNGQPVYSLYLRAKMSDTGSASVQDTYYHAFDIGEFARTYQKDSLHVNLYYYTKTKQGEEIYTGFKDNPMRFKFPVRTK